MGTNQFTDLQPLPKHSSSPASYQRTGSSTSSSICSWIWGRKGENARKPLVKRYPVAPVHFGSHLAGFLEQRKNNPKEPIALPSGKDLPYLKKFAGPTRQRPEPTFVFIRNVDQLHWVTVKVDFASGKVPSGGLTSE